MLQAYFHVIHMSTGSLCLTKILVRPEINSLYTFLGPQSRYLLSLVLMCRYLGLWLGLLLRCVQSRQSLLLENLALRQQLAVRKRKDPRPRIGAVDKIFW
jgi:hypothetical protein